MNKNYEKELPEGYKEAYHIDAQNKKTATIFTVLSLIPMVILLPLSFLLAFKCGFINDESEVPYFVWTGLILLVFLAYIVLHELLHGITYKLLTKQKLTFGLTLTCAYCGVPNIYVYRKTAILALIMPFAVFSVVFIATTIIFFYINSYLFLASVFILSMHLGGCVGDLYGLYLFLFKFKDSTILMRDTGPAQFFYVKE